MIDLYLKIKYGDCDYSNNTDEDFKMYKIKVIRFVLQILHSNESRDDLSNLNMTKRSKLRLLFLCLLTLFCRRWNESIYIIFTHKKLIKGLWKKQKTENHKEYQKRAKGQNYNFFSIPNNKCPSVFKGNSKSK